MNRALERLEKVKKFSPHYTGWTHSDLGTRLRQTGYPVTLGYSCAGTVVDVAQDAGNFTIGDRVACAGQNYASHAEMVYVPKHLCVKIPEVVDFEDASFVTLGAIALQESVRLNQDSGTVLR